jgi:hypothetical protein
MYHTAVKRRTAYRADGFSSSFTGLVLLLIRVKERVNGPLFNSSFLSFNSTLIFNSTPFTPPPPAESIRFKKRFRIHISSKKGLFLRFGRLLA